ncbi:Clr5 domain-containing protein [Apiospora rasikravindrae]|uniref:Clr5 domain-containing protein n=1 Tax=Apiospora rasikravindrae TaxID=990691 RepID=A0ABR1S2A3_9PEZI
MPHPAADEEEEEGSSRPPPPSSEPAAGGQARLVTPRDPEDWERVKPILKELYLNQGLTLKALVQEMRDVHHVKATIRQYNHRFAKWGWRKYKKKRQGSVTAQSTVSQDESYQGDVSSVGSPEAPSEVTSIVASPSSPTKLFIHASDFAARVSSGLNSYRNYIRGWAATDPRWLKPTRYQSIEVDRVRIPIEDQLLVARHYVRSEDYTNAGQLLRVAFLSIEPLVNDQHISGAWDLFIIAPLVICEMGRDTDIVMKLYTNYLYQQMLVKRGKQHPMTSMALSLRAAALEGHASVFNFISKLCALLYDTFLDLRGLCASTLYSRWHFARLTNDTEAKAQMADSWRQLAKHAESEFGALNIMVLNFQSMALQGTTRGLTVFNDEEAVRGLERIATVTKQQWRQSKNRSDRAWQAALQVSVYRLSHYAMAKYWATQQQPSPSHQGQSQQNGASRDNSIDNARARLVQYCQDMVFLEPDVTPDAQWGKYGAFAENLLREAGLEREAQAVARWRQQREIDPAVRAMLEGEEAERAGDTEWWSSSADDKMVVEEESDSD